MTAYDNDPQPRDNRGPDDGFMRAQPMDTDLQSHEKRDSLRRFLRWLNRN